jgi:hypothetical protein
VCCKRSWNSKQFIAALLPLLPNVEVVSLGRTIPGSETPWANQKVKTDGIFLYKELVVWIECDENQHRDGNSAHKNFPVEWNSLRDLICERWKMIYGSRALSLMYPKHHLLVIRVDSTLPYELADTYPKNDMGYVIRAEKVAKVIEDISQSTDWPANHFRLSLVDMGGRTQPGVAVKNCTDVFIDFTSILDLSGPAVVREFKSCTELVLACFFIASVFLLF